MNAVSSANKRGPGRPRGGAAATRATRDSIVAAALGVFADSGYGGASLREIARQCGVSHATLLHHFPRKAELLVATLELRDETLDKLPLLDDQGPTGNPLGESLDEVLVGMVEGARRNQQVPGLLRMYSLLLAEAGNPDHPAHEYFRRRTARFIKGVSGVFRAALADGTLSHRATPEELATHVMGLWDGLQLDSPVHPTGIDVPAQLEFAFEGILGRPLDRGARDAVA